MNSASRAKRPASSSRSNVTSKLMMVAAVAMFMASPLALAQETVARPGTFPIPSVYPKSWELKFEHGKPQRIVVETTSGSPQAFWYITYTVTNSSNQERPFLPILEFLTNDGRVIRSDDKIPPQAFNAVKQRERNQFLETQYAIGGDLRIGPDQAKEGVAIWAEPAAELGNFSIFVGGISGEFTFLKDTAGAEVKNTDGKPIILRKTLQLNYLVRGDEVYPGEDAVNENAKVWVMR